MAAVTAQEIGLYFAAFMGSQGLIKITPWISQRILDQDRLKEFAAYMPRQKHLCNQDIRLTSPGLCLVAAIFAFSGGIAKRRIRHMAVYAILATFITQAYILLVQNMTIDTNNPFERIVSSEDALGYVFLAIFSEYICIQLTKSVMHHIFSRFFNMIFQAVNPGVQIVRRVPSDSLIYAKPRNQKTKQKVRFA